MKRILGYLSTALSAALVVGMVACTPLFYGPDYSQEMRASVLITSSTGGAGSGTFITATKVLTARHVARLADPNSLTPTTLVVTDIKGKDHLVVGVEYPPQMVDAAILVVKEPLEGYEPAIVSCRLPSLGEQLVNVGNPWGFLHWFVGQAWVAYYDTDFKGAKESASAVFNGLILFQGVSIGGQSGSAMFDSVGNVVGVLVSGYGSPDRSHDSVDTLGGMVATAYICQWLEEQINPPKVQVA